MFLTIFLIKVPIVPSAVVPAVSSAVSTTRNDFVTNALKKMWTNFPSKYKRRLETQNDLFFLSPRICHLEANLAAITFLRCSSLFFLIIFPVLTTCKIVSLNGRENGILKVAKILCEL